jgi:hypothetical protein
LTFLSDLSARSIPLECDLSTKTTNTLLTFDTDEQTEALLDHRTFTVKTGGFQCPFHESCVDLDAMAHVIPHAEDAQTIHTSGRKVQNGCYGLTNAVMPTPLTTTSVLEGHIAE